MNINRFGTFHGAPYRYINFCRANPDKTIRWFHLEGDEMIEMLRIELELCNITNLVLVPIANRVSRRLKSAQRVALVAKRWKFLHNKLGMELFRLYLYMFIRKDNNLDLLLKSPADLSWCGSNDVDNSLVLLSWIKLHWRNLVITYSYKEHRCSFRLDEGLALALTDKLVVPTKSSIVELNEVYGYDLFNKTRFADEDWRSESINQSIAKAKIQKLSERDGYPHVIILTRYAEYGDSIDDRRGSRINFLNIIQVFVDNGIKVHLKAMCICENIGAICKNENTPYHDLALKYPDLLFIEEPIKLNIDSDYLELSKYDFGILHNYKEGEKTNTFSRINIPNRLFEYYASNVQPIVIRDTLVEVEDIIRNSSFGIIVDTYKEAAEVMREYILQRTDSQDVFIFEKSFEKFMSVLLYESN